MKQSILKHILPTPAFTLLTLILPVAATIYFIVTQYSDQFVAEQDVSYFDVQSSWVGRLFLDQSWLNWFNRFMDFALWGLLAIIVLFAVWFIGSTKVAVKNHYAQEGFTNFRVPHDTWHGRFFVVGFLKLLLIITVIYSVLSIVARLVPRLSVDISFVLQGFTWDGVLAAATTCVYIVLFQILILTSFKTFKLLRTE